ncbi:uncharacterized protein AMSG_01972 [Thecamonas trahens ATCC 50062]|uniref:Pseudouridine synthase RsuA/RluA-like domain-containing protein n=1 Tax=Thecamonas trahens ATCC 50062 TaxID=461836 RepID=A0A0L0DWP4_THETB|nr:hypothetical protein AMSG_01972 [Thecamonas trahens ATCC 50062]KNC55958.1 hypothetical protein AMSG_01972 [Thecamonas trahens ATCC 50062]|eukprot:XP_013761005.1 hypothetical protein AMSG_01972 [Thecamonas trahens ATCC 50062]
MAPYVACLRANARGRWFGRELVEVISTEFRSYSEEYATAAVADGRLGLVRDGCAVAPGGDLVVRPHDVLFHSRHVHELPIALPGDAAEPAPIEVIDADGGVVVVNKPRGMPVHPTGRYSRCTVTTLLEEEFGKLHPVHRLDAPTSGVIVLARTVNVARELHASFRKHSGAVTSKEYLAQVEDPALLPFEQQFVINAPILEPTGADYVRRTGQGGREARTEFEVVDRRRGLVRARPITGRTHQIRVHLAQEVGSAIVGDHLYGREESVAPDVAVAHVAQLQDQGYFASASADASVVGACPVCASSGGSSQGEALVADVPQRMFAPARLALHAHRVGLDVAGLRREWEAIPPGWAK